MLKPYRQIEDAGEFAVYEFKTIYLYVMYVFLGFAAVGWFTGDQRLSIPALALMVLYFLVVSTQYIGLRSKIKRASKESSVEMSGNKWSFSNPLRVKIKKKFI
jgi:hypothetical protein